MKTRPPDEAEAPRETGQRPGRGWRLQNRFPRAPLRVAALAVVGLWLAAGASAAQAGVRIVSPADEAIVPTAKVRVALAARDVSSLRVSLDNSDITRRLTRRGRLRVGVLGGRPVEPGAHWLQVRWRPAGGGGERTLARRFMVARRARPLARALFPRRRPHSASGVVRLRLAVAKGVGLMRVWVNGRRARVRHLGRLWPTVSLTLGARHGVRFGRNRVRVLLHHFRRARYDVETFTVRVRRSRPLAAGIARYRGEAGGRAVRLDGRGARPTRPGRRLCYSWRITRRPRGSRARLLNRASARPRLPIDIRGRYRLELRVNEHAPGRARGAATSEATSHPVTVLGDTNAAPLGPALKIDLSGARRGAGVGAITIDDAPGLDLPPSDCTTAASPGSGPRHCVYPTPNVDFSPYLLVLDALTLEPKAPIKQLPLGVSDDALRDAISPWARPIQQNVIAILVNGAAPRYTNPPTLAELQKPSAYIFTPTAAADLGIRSGWYSEASTTDNYAEAEIGGFFQKSWPVGKKSASQQYQFVPGGYAQFDTSKANVPAGQNTMVVAGKEYTSQLSGDGFQVLVVNKALEPILGTPTTFASDPGGMSRMANLLGQARSSAGSTVFVQSIGHPVPTGSRGGRDGAVEWNDAAAQIEALGGNRDVFLSLGDAGNTQPAGTTGWYALVAAPQLAGAVNQQPPEVEASAPLTRESGDLSGVLRRNQSWQYEPMLDEVGGESVGELVMLAYQPPSNWPYSDPGSRDVLDYLANYDHAATDLKPLGAAACYDPGSKKDVRSSYCNINTDWATISAHLGDSGIDGGVKPWGVCGAYPGPDAVHVDAAQYARVCDQIARETGRLSHVSKAMLNIKIGALSDSALSAYLAVEKMTEQVKADVEATTTPKHNVTGEAFEIAATSLELISRFIPDTEAFEGVLQMADWLVPGLSLAGEIISLVEGGEQGESAVHAPTTLDPGELATEMQNRLTAAGAAFDHVWDMLISDYAKLEAAYQNFEGGIWTKVPDDLDNGKPMMQNGVRHWAAGKLMAATYDVWLVPSGWVYDQRDGKWWRVGMPYYRDVKTSELPTIGCYVSDYDNNFFPFSSAPADGAYYWRDKWGLTLIDTLTSEEHHEWPIRGNNIRLLAQSSNVWDNNAARYYPPQSLLSQLYSPPSVSSVGGGYGWERPWLYTKGQPFAIHESTRRFWIYAIYQGGCQWFAAKK